MKPTLISNPTITLDAIQDALKASSKNLEKKLLALQLILTGKTHKETCRILNIGRNTLTRWLKIVNMDGIEGLSPSEKIGRPPKLSSKENIEIRNALKLSPVEHGLRGRQWTGKVFQRFLQKKFGKQFSLSAAYKIYNKISASSLRDSLQMDAQIDHALQLMIKTYRLKVVHNLVSRNAL